MGEERFFAGFERMVAVGSDIINSLSSSSSSSGGGGGGGGGSCLLQWRRCRSMTKKKRLKTAEKFKFLRFEVFLEPLLGF
jgi:hypothetical protein